AIFAELSKPLDPSLIERRKQGSSQVPYLEGFEAINQANRLFGYDGWGTEVLSIEYHERGNARFYTAQVRITVLDWPAKTDVGVGALTSRDNADEHDKAVKTAVTDAMKRAL